MMSIRLRRGLVRNKAIGAQNDAAEQMPWRCAVCNVPVRKGVNDPCDCTRAILLATVDTKVAH